MFSLTLQGVVTSWNPAAERLFGYYADEIIGHPVTVLSPDEGVSEQIQMHVRIVGGGATERYESSRRRKDGSDVEVAVTASPAVDETGLVTGVSVMMQDITERKRMERDLAYQALHDPQTGLANRTLFTDRLTHALAAVRRDRSELGVIFLDIDQFKVVNDSVGRSVGDQLLNRLGERIASIIGPGDVVARLGGDHFAILCNDAALAGTAALAERILTELRNPTRSDTAK